MYTFTQTFTGDVGKKLDRGGGKIGIIFGGES